MMMPPSSNPPPLPPRQVRGAGPKRQAEERDAREHQHAQGVAVRAPQEPVPHQGREDHAGHHHQDDAHPGLHLVRQRAPPPQEGEQDGAAVQVIDKRTTIGY